MTFRWLNTEGKGIKESSACHLSFVIISKCFLWKPHEKSGFWFHLPFHILLTNCPCHQPLNIVELLFSRSVMSDFLWPHGLQHARLPCPSLSPGVCSNSCPLNWWCHPTISSSVTPFSSCHQSFSSIRVFSNESALLIRWSKYWSFSSSCPPNEYSGLIPWGLTGLISLLSKRLSRAFSSTTVKKY